MINCLARRPALPTPRRRYVHPDDRAVVPFSTSCSSVQKPAEKQRPRMLALCRRTGWLPSAACMGASWPSPTAPWSSRPARTRSASRFPEVRHRLCGHPGMSRPLRARAAATKSRRRLSARPRGDPTETEAGKRRSGVISPSPSRPSLHTLKAARGGVFYVCAGELYPGKTDLAGELHFAVGRWLRSPGALLVVKGCRKPGRGLEPAAAGCWHPSQGRVWPSRRDGEGDLPATAWQLCACRWHGWQASPGRPVLQEAA